MYSITDWDFFYLLLPLLAILVNITLRYLPLVPINSTIMVSRIWFLSDPCPEHFSDTQPLPPLLSFVLFLPFLPFCHFWSFWHIFNTNPSLLRPLSSAEKFNLTWKIGPNPSPHTHSSIVKSGGICVWYNKDVNMPSHIFLLYPVIDSTPDQQRHWDSPWLQQWMWIWGNFKL